MYVSEMLLALISNTKAKPVLNEKLQTASIQLIFQLCYSELFTVRICVFLWMLTLRESIFLSLFVLKS